MGEHIFTRAVATGLIAIVLAGCAGQDEKDDPSRQDVTQAVKDFIEVRELKSIESLRTGSSDSWHSIEDYYLVYKGRRDEYLVEFVRRCHELSDNTRIIPDQRWASNTIRAKFDTIRGCRIARIYALSEAEAEELKNIGEAPGSRN